MYILINVFLSAVVTNAVVASCVVDVPADAVGAAGTPVSAGDASGAFNARLLVTVVEKAASLPNANASSLRVFNAAGDASTSAATSAATNAVDAAWVVLVPTVAVGTVGTPVKSGPDNAALSAKSLVRLAILDWAMAAEVLISALTIVSSRIIADVTAPVPIMPLYAEYAREVHAVVPSPTL